MTGLEQIQQRNKQRLLLIVLSSPSKEALLLGLGILPFLFSPSPVGARLRHGAWLHYGRAPVRAGLRRRVALRGLTIKQIWTGHLSGSVAPPGMLGISLERILFVLVSPGLSA